MDNQTTEELQAIVDGAPDKAIIWCEDTSEYVAVFVLGDRDWETVD